MLAVAMEWASSIFKVLWKRRDLRPHLLNAMLTVAIATVVFFYIDFRHSEAMAEIHGQATLSDRMLDKIRHISERVDDIYKILADR